MRKPRRPYLMPLIFLVLLVFTAFIALTSHAPGDEARQFQAGRVVYLPLAVRGACPRPPCPTAIPYPLSAASPDEQP